jgi:uncharacterized membrane protein YeaQ/YmgE (transglycosylase-associated protein family)
MWHQMSHESLIVILVVGLVAGWLAGMATQGSGFGLIGDVIVGVLGALIGNWLLPRLHIHLPVTGFAAMVVQAFIGAIVLLVILRLIRGPSWGYRR